MSKAKVMALASKAKDVYEVNKFKVLSAGTATALTVSNFVMGASAAEDVTSTISDDLVSAMSRATTQLRTTE